MTIEKPSRENFYSKRSNAKRKHENEERKQKEQRRRTYDNLLLKQKKMETAYESE